MKRYSNLSDINKEIEKADAKKRVKLIEIEVIQEKARKLRGDPKNQGLIEWERNEEKKLWASIDRLDKRIAALAEKVSVLSTPTLSASLFPDWSIPARIGK